MPVHDTSRGRPPAIQQTCFGQCNGTGANGPQASGGPTGAAQKLHQTGRDGTDQVVTHHQQRVEWAMVERHGLHAETGRGLHGAAVLGQQVDVVHRFVDSTVGHLEGRTHGQAQYLKFGVNDEADLVHGGDLLMTVKEARYLFRPPNLHCTPESRLYLNTRRAVATHQ